MVTETGILPANDTGGCSQLHTDPKRGLSAQEAERRLWENGENRLPEAEKKSVLQSFLEQLNDPLIYVLLAAALISVLLGEYSDAGIIAFVVCLNAAVGVLQEGKAQRALDSLKQLMQPQCGRDPGRFRAGNSGGKACCG